MKLSKQWNHWCYRLKLKDTMKYKRLRHKYVSLKGCGRWWRVNRHNEFQYSEVFETFDKWGNSTEGTFAIPQSFAEFEAILRKAQSNCNGFCGEYECKENKTNCLRKAR